jgi:Domain of unknown function (DUF4340)
VRLPEFWKTYAAVLVAGGLAAYVYFVEWKKPDTPDGGKPKEKVFVLDKAKVGEIQIVPADAEKIRVVRDGTGWKMTAPAAVPADTAAVESMIGSLESLEIDEVVTENAGSLADFGLDKPSLSLEAQSQGAPAPLKLLVGGKLADGSGIYAKLPTSNRVFTVASWAVTPFEKKPFDLRDRDLLHVKRDDVKSLEVAGPEGGYVLAKVGKDEWAITKPLSTRAGRWAVDSLLGAIESLRLESVASEDAQDLKPFGLEKPTRTITVALADGSSKTLEIGGSAGDKKWHARLAGSPLVAVVPGALVDDLAKGLAERRAKRLLEVATYEVSGFDVLVDAGKKVYAKSTVKDKEGLEKPQWKRTVPEAKDVETSKVEDALFKLGGVEVLEFLDQPREAAAYGLDAPAFKLLLRLGGEKGEAELELGRKDGSVYARRPGDAAVLKLDPTKADELIKAFSEL